MQTQPPPLPQHEKKPNLEESFGRFMEQASASFKAIEIGNQNMKASIRNLEAQVRKLSASILNGYPGIYQVVQREIQGK